MDPSLLVPILGLLLVKEAGLPIPIPGDLLVLGAGVSVAGRGPDAVAVLLAILLAGYLGGSLQFAFVRGAMRRPLLALLERFGVPRSRLDALAVWLARKGSRGVALARMTPGVRIGAIAASGLAALRFPVFVQGLVAGNAVFVGGHFLLGYAAGPAAEGLIGRAGGLGIGLPLLVALAAAGAVGWPLIQRRTARGASAGASADIGEPAGGAYEAWADAACPACLALTVARQAISGGAP